MALGIETCNYVHKSLGDLRVQTFTDFGTYIGGNTRDSWRDTCLFHRMLFISPSLHAHIPLALLEPPWVLHSLLDPGLASGNVSPDLKSSHGFGSHCMSGNGSLSGFYSGPPWLAGSSGLQFSGSLFLRLATCVITPGFHVYSQHRLLSDSCPPVLHQQRL